jgi:hypothetical protein
MRRPVASVPVSLQRRVSYRRTPIIDGKVARPLLDVVSDPGGSTTDLFNSLRLSDMAPHEEPMWDQTHEFMLRTSLAYFCASIIPGPYEPPYNGKFLICKFHLEWDQIINTYKLVCLNAPRDHGKSHTLSLGLPLWNAAYVYPGRQGYIFSRTQELAEEILDRVAKELLSNPKLAHLLPTTRDRMWRKREIQLINGSVIRARGYGVSVRGGHPHWLLADDVLGDDDLYSETVRKRSIDYFTSALVNMVVPGGQIVVIGTPMHQGDLYAYLRQSGEFFFKSYPAIAKDGTVLFPERYNRALLEKRKRILGSARFAREFLCVPLTDEESLFPSTLFEGADIRLPYVLGLPAKYWHDRGMTLYTGIDFAMSSNVGADYTVIFTVAVDENMNRWIANIRRGRGWGFQRQLQEIKSEYALMQPAMIHAEANQMQRIFTDEIIRETDIPIRKFFTSGVQPRQPWRKGMSTLTLSKHHLDRGVPSLRMTLENRKWRIPRGDERSRELTDLWMGEMQSMSWANGQVVSVGDHDDMPMATWICDSAVRAGGFDFSFGPDTVPTAPKRGNVGELVENEVPSEGDSDDWRPKEGVGLPGFDDGFNF